MDNKKDKIFSISEYITILNFELRRCAAKIREANKKLVGIMEPKIAEVLSEI